MRKLIVLSFSDMQLPVKRHKRVKKNNCASKIESKIKALHLHLRTFSLRNPSSLQQSSLFRCYNVTTCF